MNEVLQAVLDYVQTPQTDYALLITGPWGCGKTYFWKNVVEPKLRQVKCDGTPLRPLYASLYGCQSTKDIDTQLFLASHPHLRKKWATRLSAVGGNVVTQIVKAFTRFELPAIDLRWLVNTKHAVLCFDDLERTRLPMKEALGYINTFVEHEHAKVVILCNEDEIRDPNDKNTYTVMKEKVVGASLTFRPELDAVFRTLIDEYRSRAAFHEFLSKNAELLRNLFDRSKTQNIRSLRRALSALAVIFDALDSSKIDPNAVAKQLTYAVAPTSFELHGRGADPDKLRKILSMEHMAVVGMSISNRKSEKTDEEKYEEEFAERYLRDLGLSEWGDAVGCPPICEFLLTGVLDRLALVAWAEKLTQPPDEREERIKRLSFDPRDMEDEEFARTANQVLQEVEAGEIVAVRKYVDLFDLFGWFGKVGLIQLSSTEVLENFSAGLSEAEQTGRLEADPMLRHGLDHPAMGPRTDEGRTFRQRVLEANERVLSRGVRERVQAATSRLDDDVLGFINSLADDGESGLLFTPVFQELDADDTAARILALPNSLKARFGMAVQVRAKHVPPAKLLVELGVLRRIRERLKAYCEASRSKEPMPMSLFNVQGIVEGLDRTIEGLRQLKQQKEAPASGSVEDQPRKEQGGNDDDVAETEDLA